MTNRELQSALMRLKEQKLAKNEALDEVALLYLASRRVETLTFAVEAAAKLFPLAHATEKNVAVAWRFVQEALNADDGPKPTEFFYMWATHSPPEK